MRALVAAVVLLAAYAAVFAVTVLLVLEEAAR